MKDGNVVRIPANGIVLEGSLVAPKDAMGIVLFAHGSGGSRFSPRNSFVAGELQKSNLATLLMDLLTKEEEEVDIVTAELRFNIPLLADRLTKAMDFIKNNKHTKELKIGLFGSSTGAGAALIAAAKHPQDVSAVASRGGRPDLAMDSLPQVRAPTLLIVGSYDNVVIDLNRKAMEKLKCEKKLEIVPEASHLFEEPGKLGMVAKIAAKWFRNHLK